MKQDYAVIQKILHWVIGLIIIVDLFAAQKFGDFMENWDRLESRSDHATLGVTVAVLFLLRMFFRYRYGAPPLSKTMPNWQIYIARFTHFLFYIIIAFLLLSGLLTAFNADSQIMIYQIFNIVSANPSESSFVTFRQFHELMTNILIALIVLHIIAALYHHFVVRDGITRRMLIFWRSEK